MKKYVAKRIKNMQKNIVVWYNLKKYKGMIWEICEDSLS